MTKRYLTVSDVANELQVSDRMVRSWIETGQLTAFEFDRGYRILSTDLQKFVQQHRVKPQEIRPREIHMQSH